MNTILCDWQIRRLCEKCGMISPFVSEQVRVNADGEKVISYGLSSYGYDVRLSGKAKVYGSGSVYIADPKSHDVQPPRSVETDGPIFIPAHGYAQVETMESFVIPPDVMTMGTGKSTYSRCGVMVYITPFEPGWIGKPTLLVVNVNAVTAKLYTGEGIAQILFFLGSEPEVTYAHRKGKYQNSDGLTLAVL